MNNSNSNSNSSWFWSPLLPGLAINPFIIQAMLQSQHPSTPAMEPLYGSPSYGLPAHQRMAQKQEDRHPASSSSLSRHQRGRQRRKAVARRPHKHILASPGVISHDHSTGTLPAIAWMGAGDNAGAGGARRPPSRNASKVDRRIRKKPYQRCRSNKTQIHRDVVDPSVYQISTTEGMLTSESIHYRLFC